RIEASASVRVYLETFAAHGLDAPEGLTTLQQALRANLRRARAEQEIVDAQTAQRRAWNRLPEGERQSAIRAEITALEAELVRI
ncbi:MAG TPA: hypothetical protein VI542_07455, partial [Candidatus Tectomicrobia bacterium]